MIQSIASISTGIIIGFVYSWKLALLIIGIAPIMGVAGFLEMKVIMGSADGDKEALQTAGKVLTTLYGKYFL